MASEAQVDSEWDRLSDLPEPLLLNILSFLPTQSALHTALLSRRFRCLCALVPTLRVARHHFPPGRAFTTFTSRSLRLRDPSAPLHTLYLRSCCRPLAHRTASAWLARACALGLRDLHLHITADDFDALLPLILTFRSLRCLKISCDHSQFAAVSYSRSLQSLIPAGSFLATGIQKLDLNVRISCSDLKRLVMEQSDLQDLCLELSSKFVPLDLVSATVKNAKLTFDWRLPGLSLSFPALQVLDLTIDICSDIKRFHAEMPALRKATIKIPSLTEERVPVLGDLLRCLVNVSQLSIHIQKAYPRKLDPILGLSARRRKQLENRQFHLLVEPGKDLPTFPHLRNLKLSMHFHEDGMSDLIYFLQNAPVLESVELLHVDIDNYTAVEGRWKSRLSKNLEGNNQHAYFSNLHLSDKKIELIRILLLCNERHQKKPRQ